MVLRSPRLTSQASLQSTSVQQQRHRTWSKRISRSTASTERFPILGGRLTCSLAMAITLVCILPTQLTIDDRVGGVTQAEYERWGLRADAQIAFNAW